MNVVLDTSIIIDYFRDGTRTERFIEHPPQELDFYLPTIVIYELFGGESTQNDEENIYLQSFIKFFPSIEITKRIAKRAGELYRDATIKVGTQDYIIAASAMEIGAQVATLNEKDFKTIPGVKLYSFT